MLKRLFLSLVCSLLCVSVFAQESRAFKQGYSGNVEVANMTIFGKDMYGARMQFGTTHGYSFGNGAFVGAGAGLLHDITFNENFVFSVYFDSKYNFTDTKVSPFVSLRSGVRFMGGAHYLGNFANIGGGADFGRFSVRLAYELSGREMTSNRLLLKDNAIYCSLAFMF